MLLLSESAQRCLGAWERALSEAGQTQLPKTASSSVVPASRSTAWSALVPVRDMWRKAWQQTPHAACSGFPPAFSSWCLYSRLSDFFFRHLENAFLRDGKPTRIYRPAYPRNCFLDILWVIWMFHGRSTWLKDEVVELLWQGRIAATDYPDAPSKQIGGDGKTPQCRRSAPRSNSSDFTQRASANLSPPAETIMWRCG